MPTPTEPDGDEPTLIPRLRQEHRGHLTAVVKRSDPNKSSRGSHERSAANQMAALAEQEHRGTNHEARSVSLAFLIRVEIEGKGETNARGDVNQQALLGTIMDAKLAAFVSLLGV